MRCRPVLKKSSEFAPFRPEFRPAFRAISQLEKSRCERHPSTPRVHTALEQHAMATTISKADLFTTGQTNRNDDCKTTSEQKQRIIHQDPRISAQMVNYSGQRSESDAAQINNLVRLPTHSRLADGPVFSPRSR